MIGDERLPAKFWARVQETPGCWLWTGKIHSTSGYGIYRHERVELRAHRFAYERLFKAIPEGLVTDHLCRVRDCVNPAHLDVVTPEENIRRGTSPTMRKSRLMALQIVRTMPDFAADDLLEEIELAAFRRGLAVTAPYLRSGKSMLARERAA